MDGKVKTIRLIDGDPWMCKNGHLLGVMRRERIGRLGRGYRLYLLRTAEAKIPGEYTPLVWIGRLEGTMRNIQCSVCDEEKTWWANKAAMDDMLGVGVDDPETSLERFESEYNLVEDMVSNE